MGAEPLADSRGDLGAAQERERIGDRGQRRIEAAAAGDAREDQEPDLAAIMAGDDGVLGDRCHRRDRRDA